jgi:lysyl-tRNA synthetase, class II
LRIAPEIYLKKLIVGGMERVYEIGKQFRNEGKDKTHNHEFTSCEFYWSYASYDQLFDLTEEMLKEMVFQINKSYSLPFSFNDQVHQIRFDLPFSRIDVTKELEARLNFSFPAFLSSFNLFERNHFQFFRNTYSSSFSLEAQREQEITKVEEKEEEMIEELKKICEKNGISLSPQSTTINKIIDSMIGELIEPLCIQPTFLINHPLQMSPLAKKNRHHPFLSERFELFIAGKEFVNAYSELNDPFEQRTRFYFQQKDALRGDNEGFILYYIFIFYFLMDLIFDLFTF